MRRRGTTFEGTVPVLVAFLLVFAILLVFFLLFRDAGKKEFTVKECQVSLTATQFVDAANPICSVKASLPIPIKCSRNFLAIGKEGITHNGERSAYDPRCPEGVGSGVDGCIAHNAIAEEMRQGWRTFFEGKRMVFQQLEENVITQLFTAGGDHRRVCFITSEVYLNDGATVSGFLDYLESKEMREGVTYHDYFTDETFCDAALITPTEHSCFDAVREGVGEDVPYWFDEEERPVLEIEDLDGEKYVVVIMRRAVGTCDAESDQSGNREATLTIQLVPIGLLHRACDVVLE